MNKTESRVTLVWQFGLSPLLSTYAKDRLVILGGSKVKKDGTIKLSCEIHRSQKRNQEECINQILSLIESANKRPKKRKPTKLPKAKKEARLKTKQIKSEVKALRKKPSW